MSRTRFYRAGATCAAALTVASVIAGCNSSKSSSSAAASTSASASSSASAAPTAATSAAAAPATSAPAASTLAGSLAAIESQAAAGASAPAALPTKIVATKGGSFCKEIAAVTNAGLSSASDPTTPAAVKAQISSFQAEEKLVLATAPGQIKPDLLTLFGGIDKLYAALVTANYDYSKLDPTVLSSLDTPAFTAASDRIDAYLKNTCGIDTGAASS